MDPTKPGVFEAFMDGFKEDQLIRFMVGTLQDAFDCCEDAQHDVLKIEKAFRNLLKRIDQHTPIVTWPSERL